MSPYSVSGDLLAYLQLEMYLSILEVEDSVWTDVK